MSIVSAQQKQPVIRQGFGEFSLRGRDFAYVAERGSVSLADAGDDADFRRGHRGEFSDLALSGRAEFDDRRAVLFGQAEQSQRDAELVVEIPRAAVRVHFVLQGRVDHFASGRLAEAAGDSDDSCGVAIAVPGGEVLEGGEGVFDNYASLLSLRGEKVAGGRKRGRGTSNVQRPTFNVEVW